ncbi:MAG: ABC transporter permease [Burkholderiales bacterium]
MFRYYVLLGVRNLLRNPVLTSLMVLTLAVGVAASIATLTILHIMSGNPIPHKSARLLVPLVDNGSIRSHVPGAEPDDRQATYIDAANWRRTSPATRRTAVFDVFGAIEGVRADVPVEPLGGLAVDSDYFAMFDVPFLHGGAWTRAEDDARARVIVLGRSKSEKLFGNENPVGRTVRAFGQDFRVVGVRDTWSPVPRYTRILNSSGGALSGEDDSYIPFATATDIELYNNGSTSCSDDDREPGYAGFLKSECTWIQFWFETADRAGLAQYLQGYVEEQRKLGRLKRDVPPRLFDVMEWLRYLEVVSNDARLSVWLAFGFLLLCLVNTTGLLLAKFSARAAEVGVRRALGATRGAIFRQFMVEAGVVGLAGGLVGLLLSFGALALISKQSKALSVVAQMDWAMLGLTFVLAVAAAVLAGLLPTWRATKVTPALQLKSQ